MTQELRKRGLLLVVAFTAALLAGCAMVPYHMGHGLEGPEDMRIPSGEAQIERGRPVWIMDGAGHYVFSLPTKLLLWNWSVDNHDISAETEARLAKYLDDNDLRCVKVRLNEYAPGDEWYRLVHNTSMPAPWRYTFGVVSVTFYTILPDRVFAGLFGGDNYNPFTNTINLYSDHAAVALHEAGHAKDFAGRPRWFRGPYAVIGALPLVPLFHEARATGDAIGYDRAAGNTDAEKKDYKVLYPAYCTYIAGEGLRWWGLPIWYSYPIEVAATIPGHIIGRIKAAHVKEPPPSLQVTPQVAR